ncbi:hypothetical protein J5751_00720 [bacterium]|nr:hypothetical protein [bacterium]
MSIFIITTQQNIITMKKETKDKLIANGLIIATTLAIVCCLIGFTGGFLYFDVIAFKWMAGCGLLLSIILYAVYTNYLPKVGLNAINKAVKITCIVLVVLAVVVFLSFIASLFTLSICNIFQK